MFFVFSKEKISAYFISILMVCFLFFIANQNYTEKTENIVPTSINANNGNEQTYNEMNVNNNVK